jgi:hypothetical protein
MSGNIIDFFRSRYTNNNRSFHSKPYPIAICTAMYNSEPFLSRFLEAIRLLDYPRKLLSLYFTIQGNDRTYNIMQEFKAGLGAEYRKIRIERVEQLKGGRIPHIQNVVRCRNLLAEWSSPDPVFFIDHDNFPPPNSLKMLQQNLEINASISAGVYVFYKRDKRNPDNEGMINFTAFFFINGTLGSLGLNERGTEGILPSEIFKQRMWVDSVAMGATLMTRDILDEYRFIVPSGNVMSDDTAYCLQAGQNGHRFIADFRLIIPHWGYDIQFTPFDNPEIVHLKVSISEDMTRRRREMHSDGVYIR